MLEYVFFQRALLAAVVVGLLCGLLGFFVVLRRLAFVGVGVSHSAIGGVAIGLLAGWNPGVTATIFAILMALGMFWVGRDRRLSEDAVIGVFFSGAMALGLVLLSLRHGFQQDLLAYLFGNVLAISGAEVVGLSVLALVLGATVLAVFRELLFLSFDEEVARAYGRPVDAMNALLLVVMAITVVAGIRVVGVLLIEALLVVPAATAALWTLDFRRQIAISMGLGAGSGILGLVASFVFDIAAGGAIVLVAVSIFFASLLLRRGS